MSERTVLEKNKAILWARDMIARPDSCLVVTGGTRDGVEMLFIATSSGREICSYPCDGGASSLKELVASLVAKEWIVAAVPQFLLTELTAQHVLFHDLKAYYGIYVNSPSAQLGDAISASELNRWVCEVLQKMAGSSLVLDQADTGAGKWTSAHFKPNASMMEKIKSVFKGDS